MLKQPLAEVFGFPINNFSTDAERYLALAQQHGFDIQVIPMKNTHHAEMKELLIGTNLDWLRFS